MLLNKDEIRSRNIVQGFSEDCFRTVTYDLRVGTMMYLNEGAKGQDAVVVDEGGGFPLPPQGMVEVISTERIKVPLDVVGYATVKTSLCEEGILAINIGIIDPGWDGPIGSTLINFGRTHYRLKADQLFLRLTFHQFEQPKEKAGPKFMSDEQYRKDKRGKLKSHFSATFLNLKETSRLVTDEALESWKRRLIVWVPAAALSFALFAFGVTLGVSYIDRRWPAREQLRQEIVDELRAGALNAVEVATPDHQSLAEQINRLEAEFQSYLRSQPARPQ